MKQIIFSLFALISINSFGQYTPYYRPYDSAQVNPGTWTGITLNIVKDRSPQRGSYWEFNTDILNFNNFQLGRNDGTPTNISWFGDTGDVKRSPLSSIPLSSLGGSILWSSIPFSGTTSQYIDGAGGYRTFPSSGTVTSVGITSTTLNYSGTPITSSGTFTLNLSTTGITAGTYNGSVTYDTYGRATSASNMVYSTPTRSFSTTGSNNTFTISSTKASTARYSINVAVSIIGTLSSSVNITLDYSTNGGTTWVTAGEVTQTYALGITINTSQSFPLSAEIPAGALVRIYQRTLTNATATITATQQEVTH